VRVLRAQVTLSQVRLPRAVKFENSPRKHAIADRVVDAAAHTLFLALRIGAMSEGALMRTSNGYRCEGSGAGMNHGAQRKL